MSQQELKRVDDRSEELIKEFHEHREECNEQGLADDRLVFEGWTIQKIAGLQILVENMNDHIRMLGQRLG